MPVLSKRPAKRVSTWIDALVQIDDWTAEVRVRNLSWDGAMLEAETPPALDAALTLVHGEWRVAGTVCWRDGARFGIAFDELLTPPELKAMLGGTDLRVGAPKAHCSVADVPAPPLKVVRSA